MGGFITRSRLPPAHNYAIEQNLFLEFILIVY